jgi:hypothetical protein
MEKGNQPGLLLGRTFWQGVPAEGKHNFSMYITGDSTGYVTKGGNDHHVNLFG